MSLDLSFGSLEIDDISNSLSAIQRWGCTSIYPADHVPYSGGDVLEATNALNVLANISASARYEGPREFNTFIAQYARRTPEDYSRAFAQGMDSIRSVRDLILLDAERKNHNLLRLATVYLLSNPWKPCTIDGSFPSPEAFVRDYVGTLDEAIRNGTAFEQLQGHE